MAGTRAYMREDAEVLILDEPIACTKRAPAHSNGTTGAVSPNLDSAAELARASSELGLGECMRNGVANAVLLLGFAASAATPPPSECMPAWRQVQVARELMAIPEEKIVISDVALRLSELLDVRTDVAKGQQRIRALADRVSAQLGGRTDPDSRVRAINQILFKEEGFKYDAEDPMGHNVNNRHLWGLLTRKKGNCVALPVLWYSVAECLGFPVFLVQAPQHLFVRYSDGSVTANIEATSGGGLFNDDSIIQDLEIPKEAIQSGNMMKSMTKHEVVSDLILQVAIIYGNTYDYGIAMGMVEYVLNDDPKNMSAHYSGALWQTAVAATLTTVVPLTPQEARDIDQAVQSRTKNAISHARTATALGAPKPLKDGYWKVPSKSKSPEAKVITKPAAPFQIEAQLRIGGAPVMIRDHMGLVPSFIQADGWGFSSAGSFLKECARVCGPPPGNMCAAMSRYFP